MKLNGTPKGIRTPAAEMKTQYPRPLDDGGLEFGWGGWIRTNGAGVKVLCLTAWRHPISLAPRAGLEPAAKWLTATRSTN